MISTHDLSTLPDIDPLCRLMQSLAMLDAILSPEWGFRYFSFNRRWSRDARMGSMRNGQGDHYFAFFNADGCWMKGFAHEAPMSPFASDPPRIAAGLFDGVPEELKACLSEPAFLIDETTFCIWRRYSDHGWLRGPVKFSIGAADADGSAALMRCLDGRPQTYRDWAAEYYEVDVSLVAVELIYAHRPLDPRLVKDLNAAVSASDLDADVDEIGYPSKQ